MQTSGLPNFPLFDTIFCITPTKQDYMYRLYTYLATLVLARISATFRCLLCQRLLLRATETNCLELLANGNGRSRNGARASLPTGLQNIYIHKRVISSLLFCQYLPYSFDKTLADKKKTKWRPSQHKTHGIKDAQMREQYLHWQFAPICHICRHAVWYDDKQQQMLRKLQSDRHDVKCIVLLLRAFQHVQLPIMMQSRNLFEL
jgi:hypothetical protein